MRIFYWLPLYSLILTATLYYKCVVSFQKDAEIKIRAGIPFVKETYLKPGKQLGIRFSAYLFVECLMVWVSVVALLGLNNVNFGAIGNKVIRTGIVTPFVFLLCSAIAHTTAHKMLDNYQIKDKDINISITLITILFCFFLLFDNWELSLSLLAVVLGKVVWLDSSIKEIISAFKESSKIVTEHECPVLIEMTRNLVCWTVYLLCGLVFFSLVLR